MRSNFATTCWRLFIAMLLLSRATAAHAQGNVGEITDTKTLTSSPVCPEVGRGTPPGVTITRRGTARPIPGVPGARVQLTDGLAKDSDILARLKVDADVGGRGTFYLVPNIGCYPGLKGDRFAGEIPHALSSSYSFETRMASQGGNLTQALALVLDRGSVIIHWEHGSKPLVVVLPTDSVVVIGTTVAIGVDSARRDAMIYVHKGTVFVPTLGGNLTDGQVMWWRGGRPRLVTNASAQPLDETTRYYTEKAWRRGSWLKWLVGGAIVGGAGYCVATKCWEGDYVRAGIRVTQ